MPRRKRISRQLTVSVSFETTRFSTQYLIEAYEWGYGGSWVTTV
jgi:hypothetical protein